MLESAWFENKNGTFTAHILPLDAQVSCTKRIVVHDFTRDGKPDLLLLGNDENNMPETGPYDASSGILLAADGHGGWKWVPNRQHGLWAGGELRDALLLRTRVESGVLLTAENNGRLRKWSFQK